MNKNNWLTINEASILSGYHPETIRELIRQKKIHAQKFSIVWQVSHNSLLEYLAKIQASGLKRGRKPKK